MDAVASDAVAASSDARIIRRMVVPRGKEGPETDKLLPPAQPLFDGDVMWGGLSRRLGRRKEAGRHDPQALS